MELVSSSWEAPTLWRGVSVGVGPRLSALRCQGRPRTLQGVAVWGVSGPQRGCTVLLLPGCWPGCGDPSCSQVEDRESWRTATVSEASRGRSGVQLAHRRRGAAALGVSRSRGCPASASLSRGELMAYEAERQRPARRCQQGAP